MALTPSNMLPLGKPAPDFSLPGTDGATYLLRSFASGKLLLVAFICNHCPFVKHIQAELAQLGRDCRKQDVAMVAISSNDIVAYPADGMDKMRDEASAAGYVFPYLLDETSKLRKHMTQRARPISSCSTAHASWFTAGNSTTAVPAARFPSAARTCAPRSTPRCIAA